MFSSELNNKNIMRAEEVHREKLKQLGYKDEYIEELVNKYIVNCTYEFAEAYHVELLNIDSVTNCFLKCTECKNYDVKVINKEGGTYKICKAKKDDPRVIVDLKPKECADYVYGW